MPSTSSSSISLPTTPLKLQACPADDPSPQSECEETLDSYHRRVLIRAVPRPINRMQHALQNAHIIFTPAARMGAAPVRWVAYPLHGALCEGIVGGAVGVVVGGRTIHLLFRAWSQEASLRQGLPIHHVSYPKTSPATCGQAAIYSVVLATVLSGSALGAGFGIMAGAIYGGVRGLQDLKRDIAAIFEMPPPPHPQ